MTTSGSWRWFHWGLIAITVGLAVWPTAFVLVPAGAAMIIVGIVRWMSTGRT